MSKKNISFFCSSLRDEAPVRVHFLLIKTLVKEGFNISVLTIYDQNNKKIVDDLSNIGVETIVLLSRPPCFPFIFSVIKKYVISNNIKLVCSWGGVPDFLLAFSGIKTVKVSVKHEGFLPSLLLSHGPVKGFLVFLIQFLAYLKIENIICVSDFVRDSLFCVPQVRKKVIKNGICVERFNIADYFVKLRLREKFGLRSDSKIFIFVGSFRQAKDPLTIIRAFIEFNKTTKSELIMLGDGPLIDICKVASQNHASIHFFGHVSNVEDFLFLSDYLLSASLTEGCPLSVLEAMSCGLPVILSDIPAHAEISKHLQYNHVLFPINDNEALTKCMLQIVTQPYFPLQCHTRNVILENFCSSKMAKVYQQHFDRMIGSS